MAHGLFLDFDGVVCDSINECFVSSWIAFHEHYRADSPGVMRRDDYARFCAMRPFIRSGEDYLLAHELIADGLTASSQAGFDAAVERAGWEQMATFRSLLYGVRDEMISRRLDYWLSLHHVYPALQGPLREGFAGPHVWIVSTRRPQFIHRILARHGIQIDGERVAMAARVTKVQMVESLMADHGLDDGTFVDDQPDHLRCSTGSGLHCFLATWGHASPEVLAVPGFRHMEVSDLAELLLAQAGYSSSSS